MNSSESYQHPAIERRWLPCQNCPGIANQRIETVVQGEVERRGFKCESCRWWNWLDAPSPAIPQEIAEEEEHHREIGKRAVSSPATNPKKSTRP